MELLKGVPNSKEFKERLNKAKSIIAHYGWENEYTYPYSYPVKISDFLKALEDYDIMTYMSRELAVAELNGFIMHCINPWVAYQNAPKVKVQTKTGIVETTRELADVIIENGLGKEIEA